MSRALNQQIQLIQTAAGLERDRLQLLFDMEDKLKEIKELQNIDPALQGSAFGAGGAAVPATGSGRCS